MKKLAFVLFLMTVLGTASAQQLVVRSYVEKTHISPKIGTAIGFDNQYGWEYGAFYQQASLASDLFRSESQKEQLPRLYEESFGGLFFAAPVLYGDSYVVKFNVRTGVSNGENFVITPSFLGDYFITQNIGIGVGLGVRALRPTMQVSVSFGL